VGAEKRNRVKSFLIVLGVIALAGLLGFGLWAWRSVTIEQADPDLALSRFTAVRDIFAGSEPMLRVNVDGSVVRRSPPENPVAKLSHLHVLAYRNPELIRADVPFWFLKAKGPAIQYSLRGTGLDLKRLGVTAADLQRYGPCLVLDETRANGDRLLVWTE
jgi:hypothetical protein